MIANLDDLDQPLTEFSETVEALECSSNQECKNTNCCSKGKCQTSFVCYNGFKVLDDNCDFNYECYSRCCDKSSFAVCTEFKNCYSRCQTNQDCENLNFFLLGENETTIQEDVAPCCSEGHCTD